MFIGEAGRGVNIKAAIERFGRGRVKRGIPCKIGGLGGFSPLCEMAAGEGWGDVEAVCRCGTLCSGVSQFRLSRELRGELPIVNDGCLGFDKSMLCALRRQGGRCWRFQEVRGWRSGRAVCPGVSGWLGTSFAPAADLFRGFAEASVSAGSVAGGGQPREPRSSDGAERPERSPPNGADLAPV